MSNNLLSSFSGDINSLRRIAFNTPILNHEEELELINKYQKTHCSNAFDRLTISHLRVVFTIARTFEGYGLPLDDLIQEGNIGLLKAISNFNPNKGARLITFAVHYVRSEMHEFILRNYHLVKIATTKSQRKLFFNLRRMKSKLTNDLWLSEEDTQKIADELSVSVSDVKKIENRFANGGYYADIHENDDDVSESNKAQPLQFFDAKDDVDNIVITEELNQKNNSVINMAIEKLNDPKKQDIIQKRWLMDEKVTLQELASKYKVSVERIRQIEKKAMEQLESSILMAS